MAKDSRADPQMPDFMAMLRDFPMTAPGAAQFAEFQRLNAAYTARFGFPFIIAVRGLDRAAILADLARSPRDDPARAKTILEYATTREPKEPFWPLCLADLALTTHDLVMDRAT